jgi:outer membrane protein
MRSGFSALLAACLPFAPVCGETLSEAWATALAYDGTLQAAQSRLEAADAELAGARAQRLPEVSASTQWLQWNEAPAFDFSAANIPAQLPLFAGESMQLSEARVTLPLYAGGGIRRGIDAAEALRAARERGTAALTQDLKLAVADAYVGVLRTQSALAVAQSNVASLSAHARDVESMYGSGQVPRNDYLAAAVSLADAEQRALQAESALNVARAMYNRQLGRPLGASVDLDAALPGVDPALDSGTPDTLIPLAHSSRDEIAALRAAADSQRARAASAQSVTRPQFFLTGQYWFLENQFLNEEDFWTVGLGFNWRLFDSGRTRHAVAALNSEAQALGAEQKDLESMIGFQIQQAWLSRRETRERVRVTERAVEQAEENLRVARDRYRNGEGTNSEALDAEALRSLSRGNFDTARYDAALAAFRLARAVGLL